MSNYTTVNILDMLDTIGEDNVCRLLSDFSCPQNSEIELFIKNNAVDFAKKKMSVTHLVLDENGQLAAIFTLAHKALEIDNKGLSSASKRKISRYAQLDKNNDTYTVSAFLIAQLGKNYAFQLNKSLSGNTLMENAVNVLEKAQHDIGGGVMYLECEDNPQLLSFYGNEKNHFQVFNERYSYTDKTKYIQLMRFF